MPEYMVERTLPGFTPDQVRAAAVRAKTAAAQMNREGTPVRYHRSTFLPGEEKCFCSFQGASAEDVLELNRRADLPVERIVEVVHLVAEDLD
jgi:hypothetical protein